MTFNPLLPLDILLPLGAIFVAGGAFLAWRSTQHCSAGMRLLAAASRTLGLAILIWIALNPGSWQPLEKEQPSGWAVMLDRSLSMSTAEEGGTRWTQAVALADQAVHASRKPERVKKFTFAADTDTDEATKLAALSSDGTTTDIIRSGRSLLMRWPSSGLHLQGILLLSDGRQITPGKADDFALLARAQETAIYPVVIGTSKIAKDLSVAPGRRQYLGFPGQKTKITALVHNRGFTRINPTVQLLDAAGKVLTSAEVKITDESSATVALDFTPSATGYQKMRLRVSSLPEEVSTQNNEDDVSLLVLAEKTKIFLAEGSPTWDAKFLAQLFRSQPQLDVTAVFRLAGDRYYRVSSTAAATATDIAEVFPSTADDFGQFDIVIFGKGAEYFLTPDRVDLLRNFIREKGGCVIFARGKPYDREFRLLEAIEPVVWGETVDAPFRLQPTDVGQEAGLFDQALRPESDVWKKLPPLAAANRIEQQKSFSEVMVDAVADAGSRQPSFPAVITRRHGKGMVITVNADGLWQWDFFSAARDAGNLYREFWTQLVQWAVTYSEFLPGQEYSIKLSETNVHPGAPVRVRIGSRGGIAPAPAVRLIRPGETPRDLGQPQRIPDSAAWELFFTAPNPGTYAVELYSATDKKSLGTATLEVVPPPSEKDSLEPDPEFLQTLAARSGGKMIEPREIEALVRKLEPERRILDESNARWTPAWDRSWVLLGVIGLFTLEWIVRRRNGLL